MPVLATGKVNFDGFCEIAAHFLEEEDAEAMQEELKEAFRLYDREGERNKYPSSLGSVQGDKWTFKTIDQNGKNLEVSMGFI